MTPAAQAVAVALAAANVVALGAFGLDKARAAAGAWRVPEATLALLGWLGPAGAWLGVRLFRHKTRKGWFLARLALATALSPTWPALAWALGVWPSP